eukprot:jgi/Tetstr1/424985/TSEL_015455.t1
MAPLSIRAVAAPPAATLAGPPQRRAAAGVRHAKARLATLSSGRRTASVRAMATSKTDAEMVTSARLLGKELRVLGMPDAQVDAYLAKSNRSPCEEYDTARSVMVLQRVMKGVDEVEDAEALAFVSEELRELWLWKRRKGDYYGVGEMHEAALNDLQNVDKAALEAKNAEKISSVLLDDLNMTDEQKMAVGDVMRGAVVGGIQGAIWNAIALFIIFIVLFNFARG